MRKRRYDAKLLRLAEALAGEMRRHQRRLSVPQLPYGEWRRCERLARQLQLARQRNFSLAPRPLEAQLQQALRSFSSQLSTIVNAFGETQAPVADVSPGQIYLDLVALGQEFDALEGNIRRGTISATTAPIALERVELGRFRIDLHFRLWGTDPTHYMIEALDPCPAGADSAVTHPHVQDGILCAGDGRRALRVALEQGRIADFFLIIRSVLETYNAGGAYVSLERWNGPECYDCGGTILPDDAETCHDCDHTVCEDCRVWCSGCEEPYCSRCAHVCALCSEDFCANCLARCRDCRSRICENCQTEGRCHGCHERQQQQAAAGQPVRPA